MTEAHGPILVGPIRSEDYIQTLRKACAFTDAIFERLITGIKAGVSELWIREYLDEAVRGVASDNSVGDDMRLYFAIIESGERTALLHGRATERILTEGDFVTIDFGIRYKDVATDFTRTMVVGKACEKQRDIYSAVLCAINEAEERICAGMTGHEADAVARDIIKAKGYGDRFIHTLGHGFGGAEPNTFDGISLAEGQRGLVLETNMVFTIEPGIYIDGFGGVRIEDTVVLGENGVEPLFSFTRDLIEL